MKVEELIRRLKEMPKGLDVMCAAHDNADWEAGMETSTVIHFVKEDETPPPCKDEMWDDAPDECVVIRG
jgi:hypothetical protein